MKNVIRLVVGVPLFLATVYLLIAGLETTSLAPLYHTYWWTAVLAGLGLGAVYAVPFIVFNNFLIEIRDAVVRKYTINAVTKDVNVKLKEHGINATYTVTE